MIKEGQEIYYITNKNCVLKGKIESIIGKTKVKVSNCNYLLTAERLYKTRRAANEANYSQKRLSRER